MLRNRPIDLSCIFYIISLLQLGFKYSCNKLFKILIGWFKKNSDQFF